MQNDFHVHLDLSVPRRTLTILLASALLITVTPEIGSENVTLSTYYPAPSGVYNKMITTGDAYLATLAGRSVGVGTTSPLAKLHVTGEIRSESGGLMFTGYTGAIQKFSINNTLLVGGNDPGDVIQLGGNDTFGVYNFMRASNTGSREVLFQGGHVSIGMSNFGAAPGTGGTRQGSYLFINGAGAALAGGPMCDSIPRQAAPMATGLCAANQYATFTQGIYINGYSSQALGSDTMSMRAGGTASGTKTNVVLTQTPGAFWNGFADTNWGQLTSGSGRVSYFCCLR